MIIKEYVLKTDGDCHWFVIPADRAEEWEKFCNDPEGICPEWADPVGGSPSLVKFTGYSID